MCGGRKVNGQLSAESLLPCFEVLQVIWLYTEDNIQESFAFVRQQCCSVAFSPCFIHQRNQSVPYRSLYQPPCIQFMATRTETTRLTQPIKGTKYRCLCTAMLTCKWKSFHNCIQTQKCSGMPESPWFGTNMA